MTAGVTRLPTNKSAPSARKRLGADTGDVGSGAGLTLADSSGQTDAHAEVLYITLPEAAKYLSIGLRTVEKIVAAKEIPSYKFRGCRRLLFTDLERWASSQKES